MKFRPIALLCALALIVWGGFAVASVVAQIQIHQDPLAPWPTVHLDRFGTPADRAAWTTYVAFAASAIGALAVLAGLLGLVRRTALHVGVIIVLLSLALIAVDLTVIHNDAPVSWSRIATSYRDRILWRPLEGGGERWWWFVTDVLVPLAAVPILLWLLVLLTGAGKRRPGAASAAAVAGPHAPVVAAAISDQDDVHTVRADAPHAPDAWQTSPQARPVEPEPEPEAEPEAETEAETEAEAEAEAEAGAAPGEDAADEPVAAAVDPAVASPVARPGSQHDAIWFVTVQGADHGPYTSAQLRGYLEEGRLHVGTITHLAGGEDHALADVLA